MAPNGGINTHAMSCARNGTAGLAVPPKQAQMEAPQPSDIRAASSEDSGAVLADLASQLSKLGFRLRSAPIGVELLEIACKVEREADALNDGTAAELQATVRQLCKERNDLKRKFARHAAETADRELKLNEAFEELRSERDAATAVHEPDDLQGQIDAAGELEAELANAARDRLVARNDAVRAELEKEREAMRKVREEIAALQSVSVTTRRPPVTGLPHVTAFSPECVSSPGVVLDRELTGEAATPMVVPLSPCRSRADSDDSELQAPCTMQAMQSAGPIQCFDPASNTPLQISPTPDCGLSSNNGFQGLPAHNNAPILQQTPVVEHSTLIQSTPAASPPTPEVGGNALTMQTPLPPLSPPPSTCTFAQPEVGAAPQSMSIAPISEASVFSNPQIGAVQPVLPPPIPPPPQNSTSGNPEHAAALPAQPAAHCEMPPRTPSTDFGFQAGGSMQAMQTTRAECSTFQFWAPTCHTSPSLEHTAPMQIGSLPDSGPLKQNGCVGNPTGDSSEVACLQNPYQPSCISTCDGNPAASIVTPSTVLLQALKPLDQQSAALWCDNGSFSIPHKSTGGAQAPQLPLQSNTPDHSDNLTLGEGLFAA